MDLMLLTNEAEILKGGKGDNPKGGFRLWLLTKEGKAALAKGVSVEMEHTKDRRIAREIATDHLKEDRRYYSKLAKAGLDEAIFQAHESAMGVGSSSVGGNPGDKGSGIPVTQPPGQTRGMKFDNVRMKPGKPARNMTPADPVTNGKSAFAKGAL
jgi:hypothetical protein